VKRKKKNFYSPLTNRYILLSSKEELRRGEGVKKKMYKNEALCRRGAILMKKEVNNE